MASLVEAVVRKAVKWVCGDVTPLRRAFPPFYVQHHFVGCAGHFAIIVDLEDEIREICHRPSSLICITSLETGGAELDNTCTEIAVRHGAMLETKPGESYDNDRRSASSWFSKHPTCSGRRKGLKDLSRMRS